MLLHTSSPALHVHAHPPAGDGFEWTEVCVGSGSTVLVRVDKPTGGTVAVSANAPPDSGADDAHCPLCLTHGGSLAAAAPEPDRLAAVSSDRFLEDHQVPDRLSLWSAQGSRAPPSPR